MLLGLVRDVNRSTAGDQSDEAFRSAIIPLAKLLAEHITRDLFAKRLGWREFEFVFNELDARDEMTEVADPDPAADRRRPYRRRSPGHARPGPLARQTPRSSILYRKTTPKQEVEERVGTIAATVARTGSLSKRRVGERGRKMSPVNSEKADCREKQ